MRQTWDKLCFARAGHCIEGCGGDAAFPHLPAVSVLSARLCPEACRSYTVTRQKGHPCAGSMHWWRVHLAPWNAGHLAPFRFTRRPVGDLDIKIMIAYCGICHTDLHQMHNDWKNSTYPMVPGCAPTQLDSSMPLHEHAPMQSHDPSSPEHFRLELSII